MNLENDAAAHTTIATLELNAQRLQNRRYRAIVGFFGFSSKRKTKELSQREAKALLTIISKPNSTGKFKEFCFVFEQLGITSKQVAISPHCTYQDPENFFSYRRDGLKKVQWSGIVAG